MATRTKSRTKTKPKAAPATPTKRKGSSKTKNIGGEVGPVAWIIAALTLGYLGWIMSHLGMR